MGGKVEYRKIDGFYSVAYLETQQGDVAKAVDKYTDRPLVIRWNGAEWEEVWPQ